MLKTLKEVILFKDLLINLTSKELKLKYKNSFIGFLWSFLNPLMMLLIYSIAFKVIIKIQIENFALFVFVGLLPWMFVQGSITQSTNSIINNQNLVKKVYFPRIIIPLSIVFSNFINLLINFIILFFALFFFHVKITTSFLLLPVVFLITIILVSGISALLSSITVKYRDISHLVEVVFMAWFYLTPIIYSASMVPESFRVFMNLNPLTAILEMYRTILLDGLIPKSNDLIMSSIYSIVIFIIGVYVFKIREHLLAEEL